MNHKLLSFITGLFAMVFVGSASATPIITVGFNGINGDCEYSEAGFNFACTKSHTDSDNALQWHDGGHNGGNNDIIMTREDNAAFDLLFLDYISDAQGGPFWIVSSAGTFNSGATGPGIIINLLGIKSAIFRTDVDNNRGPIIDNIQAMLVPEPGTFALFGLGLAGLGYARRRKSA